MAIEEPLRGKARLRRVIGANVKRIRKQRGFTQFDLAKRANLKTVSTVGNIEAGRNTAEAKTLEAIAEALGVDLLDFYQNTQPPAPLQSGAEVVSLGDRKPSNQMVAGSSPAPRASNLAS